MNPGRRGFTLIELIVALFISACILSMVMLKFSVYEARHGGRSAAQVLISDLKMQQERAFAMESVYGITICPPPPGGADGNTNEYFVWNDIQANVVRKVKFNNIFRGDVRFAAGQGNTTIEFYPWTSGDGNPPVVNLTEWSVVQSNGNNRIEVIGGDTSFTVHIDDGGRMRVVDSKI